MARALWVSAQPPERGSGGGNIRQAALLEALAAQVETHLVLAGTLTDDRIRRQLASVREVAARPTGLPEWAPARRARHLAHALAGRHPEEVVAHRPVRRALASLLADAPAFDVVVVDSVGLAGLLPVRRANRWVLNFHNRPSGMAAHRRRLSPGPRREWLLGREEHQALAFERWAAAHYDLAVTVSEPDTEGLPGRIAVIRNGVDTDALRPTPLPAEPRLVFTGALYTLPNIDGAAWFCREVLPVVRRAVHGASVAIVGRSPGPEVLALGALPGVVIHADVASVVPHLESARVAVAPLRIGTGTRIKALEAMAAGRPLVGTSIGLEGLGVVDGEHALVADGVDALAAAVVRAIEDDELAVRLAAAGRRFVEDGFDWLAIGRDYASTVLTSLNPRPPDARPSSPPPSPPT